MNNTRIPRPEYPRPESVRPVSEVLRKENSGKNWINLNGTWKFCFDQEHKGMLENWYLPKNSSVFDRTIQVPFVFQSKLSGIEELGFYDTVWYAREIRFSEILSDQMIKNIGSMNQNESLIEEALEKLKILLNFGAVDYYCEVFINGTPIGTHEGGLTPFNFDISQFIFDNIRYNHKSAEDSKVSGDPASKQTSFQSSDSLWVVVKVYDPPFDDEIPRGKQSVERRFSGCDYEKSLGIWQSVWIEIVHSCYLDRDNCYIRPFDLHEAKNLIKTTNYDEKQSHSISVGIGILGKWDTKYVVEAELFDDETHSSLGPIGFAMSENVFKGTPLRFAEIELQLQKATIEKLKPWTPGTPSMYYIEFRLIDGNSDDDIVYDCLHVYFGFRSIEIKNNKILLNGEPLYLKMALYQGYWPESLWTPPSDEAIKRDLELTLEMGFNSLRIHQKVEDPRFLYQADRMGIILWGEMANARGSTISKHRLMGEWRHVVTRDRNHPSIITWVPLNETWGVGNLNKKTNQDWLKSIYYYTKSLDPTRPVVDNDGWEHVKTDICTIHDYQQPEIFASHYPEEEPADSAEFFTNLSLHRRIYAPGCKHEGTPIIISEWGGWGLYIDDPEVKPDPYKYWGYQGILYKNFDEILDLYERTIKELVKRKDYIIGHCYTEFNDQYQEVNGLLTFDRRPKGDLKKLKVINDLL